MSPFRQCGGLPVKCGSALIVSCQKSANYSIYFHNLFYEEFKAIKIVKI